MPVVDPAQLPHMTGLTEADPEQRDTLTVAALADEIGVPVQTIERWLKAGHGPTAAPRADSSELVRFQRQSVNEWRAGRRNPARPTS
jgi:phage portal protein BeeE